MRIIRILCKKKSSNFLPINCHFCSVFPNPWAESPCWPIWTTRSLGARLLSRPPRTRRDPRTPDPDRLWAHRVCLTFSCSVTEIENQNTTLYTELYRKRETSSSESDLKEFMGDVGYESFKNCANKNTPNYIYEQASQELSREEILFAIENGKHGVAPGISGFSREFYKSSLQTLLTS